MFRHTALSSRYSYSSKVDFWGPICDLCGHCLELVREQLWPTKSAPSKRPGDILVIRFFEFLTKVVASLLQCVLYVRSCIRIVYESDYVMHIVYTVYLVFVRARMRTSNI